MKNFFSALAIGLLLFSCTEQETSSINTPYDSLTYEIYMGDRLAGKQISWRDQDGRYQYLYDFNDRGRGPNYIETIELDADGALVAQAVRGVNYYKDSVNENYQVNGQKATWKSEAESGNGDYTGIEHFASINGSYGSVEHLIRRLMSTEDQSAPLFPGGEARIAGVKEVQVDSLNLKLVSLTGFGFTPTNIWMDQNNRFFATIYPGWFSCMPSGYLGLREQLTEIQKQTELDYMGSLANKLTTDPGEGIVITNASVFDPITKSLQEEMTVVIEGNMVKAVTPTSEAQIPVGYTTIDGYDKTLVPGMFDMHVHISDVDGILHLAGGVTSVRDLANNLELPELRDKFDKNTYVGPRIPVMAGIIDGAGEFAGPTKMLINNVEEGYKCIQEYKDLGHSQIKLYSSIKPEWVKPMAKRAHELGMRVSGHIPAYMTAEQAINAGYDEIQHVNMVVLNFLSDTIDTRTPLRFSMVAEYVDQLDPEGKEFQDFVQLMLKNDVVLDPTVSIFEELFRWKKGDPNPVFASILDRLPVQVRRGYLTGGLPVPEGMEDNYDKAHDRLLTIIKTLFNNGVKIVPGTDAMAGFAYHKELENYVKAGIPEAEVLALATLGSAEVCGVADKVGSIEPGKWADMVLVTGNPVENISDIRNVEYTIKDGKIYNSAELYKAIGVKPNNQ